MPSNDFFISNDKLPPVYHKTVQISIKAVTGERDITTNNAKGNEMFQGN